MKGECLTYLELENFFGDVKMADEKKVRVLVSEFVKAWEGSENVAEVSKKLNLKPTSVMARATKYRTDGLPLKLMARGAAKLDMGAARALLAEIRGTTVEVINQEVEARLVKAEVAETAEIAPATETAETVPAAQA